MVEWKKKRKKVEVRGGKLIEFIGYSRGLVNANLTPMLLIHGRKLHTTYQMVNEAYGDYGAGHRLEEPSRGQSHLSIPWTRLNSLIRIQNYLN